MYPAYGGSFSCTETALTSALRLLARWMPVSSARPDSGDSSYATRILLNIFASGTSSAVLVFPVPLLSVSASNNHVQRCKILSPALPLDSRPVLSPSQLASPHPTLIGPSEPEGPPHAGPSA